MIDMLQNNSWLPEHLCHIKHTTIKHSLSSLHQNTIMYRFPSCILSWTWRCAFTLYVTPLYNFRYCNSLFFFKTLLQKVKKGNKGNIKIQNCKWKFYNPLHSVTYLNVSSQFLRSLHERTSKICLAYKTVWQVQVIRWLRPILSPLK